MAARCDVASEVERRASDDLLLARVAVHSGGVLADGLALNQTKARFAAVLGSKVPALGGLREPRAGRRLVVVFSSIAVLLCSPGQANYVAANSQMDRWATESGRRGVRAASVQWGAWSGGGMASRRSTAAGENASAATP